MPRNDGWIKGKPLQIAIALRGLQPGDEVQCLACQHTHTVFGWASYNDEPCIDVYASDETTNAGRMDLESISAWRPAALKEKR